MSTIVLPRRKYDFEYLRHAHVECTHDGEVTLERKRVELGQRTVSWTVAGWVLVNGWRFYWPDGRESSGSWDLVTLATGDTMMVHMEWSE